VAYIQQGQARCFLGRVPAFALCAFWSSTSLYLLAQLCYIGNNRKTHSVQRPELHRCLISFNCTLSS
jgi:hypothetical protein